MERHKFGCDVARGSNSHVNFVVRFFKTKKNVFVNDFCIEEKKKKRNGKM